MTQPHGSRRVPSGLLLLILKRPSSKILQAPRKSRRLPFHLLSGGRNQIGSTRLDPFVNVLAKDVITLTRYIREWDDVRGAITGGRKDYRVESGFTVSDVRRKARPPFRCHSAKRDSSSVTAFTALPRAASTTRSVR